MSRRHALERDRPKELAAIIARSTPTIPAIVADAPDSTLEKLRD